MEEEAMDPEPGPNSLDPTRPESNSTDGGSYMRRDRPSEANGFLVYTRRNKKRKTEGEGTTGNSVKPEPSGCAALEGSLVVISESELVEVEVTMEDEAAVGRERGKRVIRWSDEDEGLTTVELTVMGGGEVTLEKKVDGNLARPTTVRELFETGLMEGYPVFYNGGKRGFPLRGIVKDDGILCSCSLCKGNKVVPPCQFEIHACKSYRRASQYICVENGKSLLDIVKECRKPSAETVEKTLYNFIGARPIQQSVTCQKCNGSFLATSAEKVGLLCDACMIIEYSDIDAECMKSRPLERLLDLPISGSGEMDMLSRKRGRPGRRKRKHLQLPYKKKYTKRSLLRGSTRGKGSWRKTDILSQSASAQTLKSSGSAFTTSSNSSCDPISVDTSSSHGLQKKKTMKRILKKLSDSASVSECLESEPINSAKTTKKDQTMHKLVFKDGGLPDGTEVAYYSFGKKLRDGYKMGTGIICHCCNVLVSPSQFEAHAGWASRKKPYMYIYTSNGVSLHEYGVSLLKGHKSALKDGDLCSICADGGKLVLCGGCPRAFHKECASLLSVPQGKWHCVYCQNSLRKESSVENNADAVASERAMDIDPAPRVITRCIRNVCQRDEAEGIACVICRGHDFSKSGFGPRTVILCDQCEKEFHVGCLKKCRLADLKELPKGKWFCSANCKHIYSVLQDLLCSGAEKLPEAALESIRKQQAEKHLAADPHLDVRWRLLNGKIASRESRALLSQAVAIFHDCFDPIVDSETGRDFIPSMVYGRNIRGQDFGGIYCAILTVNSMVVSAVILRIFGEDMAELPLAATRSGNQGKGYFQVLYSCIEKLLAFLNVKAFVVPDEEKSIWTEKFGFTKIPKDQLSSYRKLCWQMMNFEETSTLGKAVPKCRIVGYDEADTDIYHLD